MSRTALFILVAELWGKSLRVANAKDDLSRSIYLALYSLLDSGSVICRQTPQAMWNPLLEQHGERNHR